MRISDWSSDVCSSDLPVPHAHPLVEDEAAAVPAAVGFGHLFQIGEDAALQMDDLLDALVAEESGRFFAADAAGAEHCDALARETVGIGAPPVGKVAEALGFGIDRAREAAVTDLERVARVDQHRDRKSTR